MHMTRLYLIRHGQVEGHDTGRINGQTDVSLTALGQAQAQAAARRIEGMPLGGVYSSDLARAEYGAYHVTRGRGLAHRTFTALRELHFGAWERCTPAEVAAREHVCVETLFGGLLRTPPSGGECVGDLHARVMPCLAGLLEAHRGGEFCVVAHSGVNRVILSDALCGGPELFWKIDQVYGCLNIIDYGDPRGAIIRLMNEGNAQTGGDGLVR